MVKVKFKLKIIAGDLDTFPLNTRKLKTRIEDVEHEFDKVYEVEYCCKTVKPYAGRFEYTVNSRLADTESNLKSQKTIPRRITINLSNY